MLETPLWEEGSACECISASGFPLPPISEPSPQWPPHNISLTLISSYQILATFHCRNHLSVLDTFSLPERCDIAPSHAPPSSPAALSVSFWDFLESPQGAVFGTLLSPWMVSSTLWLLPQTESQGCPDLSLRPKLSLGLQIQECSSLHHSYLGCPGFPNSLNPTLTFSLP